MNWNVDAGTLIAELIPTITLWREARGEGVIGMTGVAWVILNRMTRYKQTASEVCLAKWQFSSMNGPGDPGMIQWPASEDASFLSAYQTWINCLSGITPDPTGGATLYYATSIPAPSWVSKVTFTIQLGHQRFYKE